MSFNPYLDGDIELHHEGTQSPPALERYDNRAIDHALLGYEDMVPSQIIRQLQRDLEQLKAECLPYLERLDELFTSGGIQPLRNKSGLEKAEFAKNLKALITKLGAK